MSKVKAVVVGAGGIAQWHIRGMLAQKRTTELVGLVEVQETSRARTRTLFNELQTECPPFYESIQELVKQQGQPDAALVATPHKQHCENVSDCLRLGLDVLVEKPMVLTASEARRLIRLRDKTGRLVVVGFNGSLSPAVHKAKRLIRQGRLGRVTAVSAYVHQNWKELSDGTWRQDPEISGGGFLFDTGSHMINTVVDLVDADVAEVMAIMDNAGTRVDITSSVSGRFANGVMFSLAGAGASCQCTSDIFVIGEKAVLRTGIWGERLELRRKLDPFVPLPFPSAQGVWEQFVKVRAGRLENPSPPEIGLRFAQLMDMIRESAATGRIVRARRRRR